VAVKLGEEIEAGISQEMWYSRFVVVLCVSRRADQMYPNDLPQTIFKLTLDF